MVFEQKFGFSVVVFCSHAAISLWFLLFCRFFGSDNFLSGFPNPFTAHFRPSFLFETYFDFSLMVFLFTCGSLTLIFCFFNCFLEMVFPIHSVCSWSNFLSSQWKFFELSVRNCAAMFFFTSSNKNFFRFTSFCCFLKHFAWNLFDFSRLVYLFSHSAKSDFEHQLLSKSIQNDQSQFKKLKSELNGIKPNFRCPLFERRSYKY